MYTINISVRAVCLYINVYTVFVLGLGCCCEEFLK